MTYEQVLRTVGNEFAGAMKMVEWIRQELPGAEYENIKRRKPRTVPSVYFSYMGQRPLSFDLRKGGGAKVYFWKPKRLSRDIEEKFDIIPERRTGWKGFSVDGLDDQRFDSAMVAVTSYWMDCIRAITSGADSAQWKREDLAKSLVGEAFPEESPVFNKQSIPHSSSKPDIFLPGNKVIIQVDGAQHYEMVSIFHPTRDVFEDQLRRDGESDNAALRAGFSVLRLVTDAVDLLNADRLREYISSVVGRNTIRFLLRDGSNLIVTEKRPVIE